MNNLIEIKKDIKKYLNDKENLKYYRLGENIIPFEEGLLEILEKHSKEEQSYKDIVDELEKEIVGNRDLGHLMSGKFKYMLDELKKKHLNKEVE